LVDKAQAEITFLEEGLRTQMRTRGINMLMRHPDWEWPYGSYKPRETAQVLGEFKAAIVFLKQREPTHHSLTAFEKARYMAQESLTLFQEPGTRTARPYWRPPAST